MCVPPVKRRGAIVYLSASLRKKTRRDSVVECVPGAKGRRAVAGTVRRHAAQQKDLCVWTQEICSVQCVLYADITWHMLPLNLCHLSDLIMHINKKYQDIINIKLEPKHL